MNDIVFGPHRGRGTDPVGHGPRYPREAEGGLAAGGPGRGGPSGSRCEAPARWKLEGGFGSL